MTADAVIEADERRKGRPAAGQDPAKRQQIIDGARRVFMEMGFDAASINDITQAAGVSKGTIYVYFANKEELFEALIDLERQTLFSDLYQALDEGGPPDVALRRFGLALARKITSDKVLLAQRTVIGIAERMPALGARFYERGPRRAHGKLSDYLRMAVSRGELSIPDIDLAAYQFIDLCVAGLHRQRLFGYLVDEPGADVLARHVESAVALFLKGYAPAG